jgi:hypothetical protein
MQLLVINLHVSLICSAQPVETSFGGEKLGIPSGKRGIPLRYVFNIY